MTLNQRVLKWADEKGILENGFPLAQFSKMREEVEELEEELYSEDFEANERSKNELGDVIVTAIILANLIGSSYDECLTMALDKIEKRTGKMQNGQFVKDQ